MKKLLLVLTIVLSFMVVTPVFATDIAVQVNSSEGSINFRSDPSRGSNVITEIPDGTVLSVSSLSYSPADDLIFGYTTYNGYFGWVSLRQTTINGFSGFTTSVSSSEGSINFRSSASTGSSVITEIPNGANLYISGIFYNAEDDLFFGQTTYNGMTGWVSLRQTSLDGGPASSYTPAPAAAPSSQNVVDYNVADSGSVDTGVSGLSVRTDVGYEGRVTSRSEEGSINFRSVPSTSSSVICEIPNNQVLSIYDIVRNEDLIWGYTEYNGTWGWISLRHTVTPSHNYQMPEYIRDWDGTVASDTGAEEGAAVDAVPAAGSIIGNWEYTDYDEAPNAYYDAGYCFYEDGTGLDTYWNQTFSYTTDGNLLTIVFDNPEYGTEYFEYSFGDAFAGIDAQYGIWLEHRVMDSQGNLVPDERGDGDGHSKLHYADLSAERLAVVSIRDDRCHSWDNRWYITTEDGETVTIINNDIHYNIGPKGHTQIIPERINGHRVTKIADNAIVLDFHGDLIIEEGIESIGSNAFMGCEYKSVTFPASVQYIGANPFDSCEDLEVIYAPENSYAARYFQEAGYNVVYTD